MPVLTARAAKRATPTDIAMMKQAIEEFEHSEGDRVKLVSADLLFHRRIFQATGNRLSGRLFHMIHRGMLNMMMVTSRMVDLDTLCVFTFRLWKPSNRAKTSLPAHDRTSGRRAGIDSAHSQRDTSKAVGRLFFRKPQ